MIKYLLGLATLPALAVVGVPLFKNQIKAYAKKRVASSIKHMLFDPPRQAFHSSRHR
jgi:hypothetical protein